jgi:hypothetical protein
MPVLLLQCWSILNAWSVREFVDCRRMFLRGWAESIYQKRGSGVAEKEEHRRGDGCNAGYPLISFCTRIWRFLRRSPSWETELGLDEQGALKEHSIALCEDATPSTNLCRGFKMSPSDPKLRNYICCKRDWPALKRRSIDQLSVSPEQVCVSARSRLCATVPLFKRRLSRHEPCKTSAQFHQ